MITTLVYDCMLVHLPSGVWSYFAAFPKIANQLCIVVCSWLPSPAFAKSDNSNAPACSCGSPHSKGAGAYTGDQGFLGSAHLAAPFWFRELTAEGALGSSVHLGAIGAAPSGVQTLCYRSGSNVSAIQG